MSTKNEIFRLLMERRGESVSGETIGTTLGISRAAVWKGITKPLALMAMAGAILGGFFHYIGIGPNEVEEEHDEEKKA